MTARCVLVTGLDASVNCSEMTALFESAGPVSQAVVLSPAADGAPGAALVWFVDPSGASEAADLLDSHPFAGRFLEVKVADAGAAARLLTALAEVQMGAAAGAPPTQAPPSGPALVTSLSGSLAAPAAAPAVAFGSGPAVPMPAPFSAGPAPAPFSAGPAPAPAPAQLAPSATGSFSELPEFGGADYNPNDWLPPSDWQPSSAAAGGAASGGGWATAAASKPPPAAAKPSPAPQQQPAAILPPGVRLPGSASSGALPRRTTSSGSGGEPAQPEWEVDERCRIYIQNLRVGCRAEDLKAYFSRFGPLVDTSVVPKQRIGFLTFAKGDAGQAAMEAVNGTSVPALSPSGSEPLKLEFRSLDKIKRHFQAKRPDVMDQPTTRVFIGYFPRTTKVADVREELNRYGETLEVVLGGGEDGGEKYCFVQFKRVQDAARAKSAIHSHIVPSLASGRQLIAAFKEPRRLY